MWLLQFLPTDFILYIINAVLISGAVITVVAFFLRWFAFVNIYRLPLQILGVALLCLGIYFRGGYAVEMEWRDRVAQLEARIEESEKKGKVITQRVDDRVMKDLQRQIAQRDSLLKDLQSRREQINRDCKLSSDAVDLYNRAVTGGAP